MTSPQRADRILVNARVVTFDPRNPIADEVAIRRGTIIGVGSALSADRGLAGGAEIIDCGGGTVLPGFVDAHLHFFALVDRLLSVDVSPESGVLSISELVVRLRAAGNREKNGWIKGKGYDEFQLSEGRHPNRWDLDQASLSDPIKLTHRSHHAHVLNSAGLERVGINRYTADPPGGLIDRDLETGEPTGVLYEMGEFLGERIPFEAPDRLDDGVKAASRELLAAGITTFQDASQNNDVKRWFQLRRWHKRGAAPQRVSMLLGWEGFLQLLREGTEAFPRLPGLRLGGLKIVLDRTTGDLNPSFEELVERIRRAHRAGWPVAVHSVERETLECALRAFEEVLKDGGTGGIRHRIEHCSVCPPELMRRIAVLGLSVVTQPAFLYFHGDRYAATVSPENLPHLYPIGGLAAHGVRLAAASDCPVVPARPWAGIVAAVRRAGKSGRVLGTGHEVALNRALRMHIREGAWMLGMERRVGTVAVGRCADLMVLNRDPFATAVEDFQAIETWMTLVNGRVVWVHPGGPEAALVEYAELA